MKIKTLFVSLDIKRDFFKAAEGVK